MRALRRLEALPPAAVLAVLMALAAVPAIAYVLGLASYFVMPDELGYVKQSIEIGERLFLLTPGDAWFNSWAQLQPLLGALPYALFDSTTAFDVAHALNAVVMASTAIPAYLLARPLVPSRLWAYAAAALSVAVPWLAMAGTVMTEVSAYPVFAWAVLGMHRAIVRPSLGRDAAALALIGLAFLSRTQFAVLGPAYFAAIALHELSWGARAEREGGRLERAGRALRRSLTLHPAAVVAAAAGLVGALVLGVDSLLGSYRVVGEGQLLPPGTLAAGREMMAYIAVGIGVLPLVASAAWAPVALARPESAETHAFAVLLVLLVAIMTVLAGSFTVQYTTGINDRYLFYIAPLLFAGMVAALVRGRRIVVPLGVSGALVAWLVFASDLAQAGASVVSPSATFHLVLDGRAYDVGRVLGNPELTSPTLIGAATLGGSLLLALVFALRRVPVLWVAALATITVLAYGVLQTGYVLDKIEATQAGVGQEFLDNRTWADAALPEGARAVAVIGAFEEPATTVGVFWDLTFWNRQVDRVAILEGDSRYDQPFHTRFTLDPATGALDGLDHREYLVRSQGDVRFGVRGAEALDARNLLVLERAPRPYEAEWAVLGAGARGKVPAGERVTVRVYGDGTARERQVSLSLITSFDATTPHRYRLAGGGVAERGRVAPGETEELEARVRVPADGYADLTLTVPAADGEAPEGGPGLRISAVATR